MAKPKRVSTHPVKKRTPVSRTLVKRLREICNALPDTAEVLAWGEPTWRVSGKIFAQLDDHHHGAEHVSVWLPAPDGAQQTKYEWVTPEWARRWPVEEIWVATWRS